MTKKTHITVGIVATIPLLNIFPKYAFIGIVGAIVADWDLLLGIKHRTITHSLLVLCLTTLVVTLCNFSIGIVFGLNYLMHLLLDSCTKTGTPFFYPYDKKYYGPKLIRTGETEDLIICLLAVFLIFI